MYELYGIYTHGQCVTIESYISNARRYPMTRCFHLLSLVRRWVPTDVRIKCAWRTLERPSLCKELYTFELDLPKPMLVIKTRYAADCALVNTHACNANVLCRNYPRTHTPLSYTTQYYATNA
jgi:hypothetical protein